MKLSSRKLKRFQDRNNALNSRERLENLKPSLASLVTNGGYNSLLLAVYEMSLVPVLLNLTDYPLDILLIAGRHHNYHDSALPA
jgi:hypothetical protein